MFEVYCRLDMLGDFTDSEIEAIFDAPAPFADRVIAVDKTSTITGWSYRFKMSDGDTPAELCALLHIRLNEQVWAYIGDGTRAILASRPAVEPTEEDAIRNMLAAHNNVARKSAGR